MNQKSEVTKPNSNLQFYFMWSSKGLGAGGKSLLPSVGYIYTHRKTWNFETSIQLTQEGVCVCDNHNIVTLGLYIVPEFLSKQTFKSTQLYLPLVN